MARRGLGLSPLLRPLLPLLLLLGLAVSAAPGPKTRTCNPNTLERGCDCENEWWEPVMYQCTPCHRICRWNADRALCVEHCPVFADQFFTTSLPSTTVDITTTPRTSTQFTTSTPVVTSDPNTPTPPLPKQGRQTGGVRERAVLPVVVVLLVALLVFTVSAVIWQWRRQARGSIGWPLFHSLCPRTPIEETGVGAGIYGEEEYRPDEPWVPPARGVQVEDETEV